MHKKEIEMILQETNAIRTGHFVYTSGKHGETYINKDAVYLYPKKISRLCQILAESFADDAIDIVVAPALGGIVLTQWTAFHLTNIAQKNVLAVYAEKSSEHFCFKRGYDDVISGKRVLILEDILTTGQSAKKVITLTQEHEGIPVAVGALCNRGNITPAQLADIPKLVLLLNIPLFAWAPNECPLCKQNIPLTLKK